MDLDSTTRVSEPAVRNFLASRESQGLFGPSSFFMDRELVCANAAGESILRLPWFEEDLFVGRQVPDISEIPLPVRSLATTHYEAALAGERGRFDFVSYGQAYGVEVIPVHRDDGRITGVLGVAIPSRTLPGAAAAYERTADRLEATAAEADTRADRYRAAGHHDAEAAERDRAGRSRRAAARARCHVRWLTDGKADVKPLSLTPREADVLVFASHGLTSAEIAEQLGVSRGTVRTHLEKVYFKLGVGDKAAAVAAALRHGLID